METVKIKDIKTGAIKTVKKSLASDYIGTKRFELVVEDKKVQNAPRFSLNKEEK